MALDLPDAWAILLTAVLILPGFVVTRVFELVIASPRRDFSKSLIEFIGYSALHYVLFSWLIFPRLQHWLGLDWNTATPGWSDYAWVIALTIALPAAWPIVFIWVWRRKVVASLPGVRSMVPAAWDFFFGQKRAAWVIIRLRNGESVAGFYGKNSFASGYPEPREIYLEQVHTLEPSGAIGPRVEGGAGVLIQGEDIHLIEFLNPGDPT